MTRRLSVCILLALLAFAALAPGRMFGQTAGAIPESCIRAAREALGAKAEILRYGYISTPEAAEALAVVRLESTHASKGCIPLTEMIILQLKNRTWQTVFEARGRMQIKNSEGFVGIEYIDDAFEYPGYCLGIEERKPSEPFSFSLSFLKANGGTEGLPIYIDWNRAVKRYQSTTYGDPPQFEHEVRNPPHISTGISRRGR